jgi:hypothetical protein
MDGRFFLAPPPWQRLDDYFGKATIEGLDSSDGIPWYLALVYDQTVNYNLAGMRAKAFNRSEPSCLLFNIFAYRKLVYQRGVYTNEIRSR